MQVAGVILLVASAFWLGTTIVLLLYGRAAREGVSLLPSGARSSEVPRVMGWQRRLGALGEGMKRAWPIAVLGLAGGMALVALG